MKETTHTARVPSCSPELQMADSQQGLPTAMGLYYANIAINYSSNIVGAVFHQSIGLVALL